MVKVDLADDIFEAIKERAEPLVDDVNTVLRRELSLGDSLNMRRADPGSLLAPDEYLPTILKVLGDAGAVDRANAVHRKDIIERVGEVLADRLSESDYTRNSSGHVRWEHRTGWMLTRLRQQGQIDSDERGGWWLTEAGSTAYKQSG